MRSIQILFSGIQISISTQHAAIYNLPFVKAFKAFYLELNTEKRGIYRRNKQYEITRRETIKEAFVI